MQIDPIVAAVLLRVLQGRSQHITFPDATTTNLPTLTPPSIVDYYDGVYFISATEIRIQSLIQEMLGHFNTPPVHLPPPNLGVNEERMAALQKKRKDLNKEALPVPNEYYCALTNIVMTTPVALPTITDSADYPNRIEKLQIEHWLRINNTCPFTRKPLTPEQLIVDNALQNRIADFIAQEEINQNEPVPALTNQFSNFRSRELKNLINEAEAFLGPEPLPAKRNRQ